MKIIKALKVQFTHYLHSFLNCNLNDDFDLCSTVAQRITILPEERKKNSEQSIHRLYSKH